MYNYQNIMYKKTHKRKILEPMTLKDFGHENQNTKAEYV